MIALLDAMMADMFPYMTRGQVMNLAFTIGLSQLLGNNTALLDKHGIRATVPMPKTDKESPDGQ
jgi:hypothetical protein